MRKSIVMFCIGVVVSLSIPSDAALIFKVTSDQTVLLVSEKITIFNAAESCNILTVVPEPATLVIFPILELPAF